MAHMHVTHILHLFYMRLGLRMEFFVDKDYLFLPDPRASRASRNNPSIQPEGAE
jgi:hypothetical protein